MQRLCRECAPRAWVPAPNCGPRALGPAASPGAEGADAGRHAWCWGSSPPSPSQEGCACPGVRSCLCARVSFTDLLLLPGSVRLRASSKILPDFTIFFFPLEEEQAQAACNFVSEVPFPSLLPPPPALPFTALCLVALVWLQDFLRGREEEVIRQERGSARRALRGGERSGPGGGGWEPAPWRGLGKTWERRGRGGESWWGRAGVLSSDGPRGAVQGGG